MTSAALARLVAIASNYTPGQNTDPRGNDMPAVYGRIENISALTKNIAIPAANTLVDIDVATTLSPLSVDFIQSGDGRIKYVGLPNRKMTLMGIPFLERQSSGVNGMNAVIIRTRAAVETTVGTMGKSNEVSNTAVPAIMLGADDIITNDEFEMRVENLSTAADFRCRGYFLELRPRVTV